MINAKHFLYQGGECTQLLGGPILISDFATLFRSRIMPLDLLKIQISEVFIQ
jgi:hypothetical protein